MIALVALLLHAVLGAEAARQDAVSDADRDALMKSARLGTDICHDLSKSKFICEHVLGEFCTYCRSEDGNKCFMNKDVEKAEKGAYVISAPAVGRMDVHVA